MTSNRKKLLRSQHDALEAMKLLLKQFVDGEVDTAHFLPRFRKMFGPFDPPDLSAASLSKERRRELELFAEFMGGWQGEHESSIPKRAEWEYGKSVEPFGWIDSIGYRSWIRARAADADVELWTAESNAKRSEGD